MLFKSYFQQNTSILENVSKANPWPVECNGSIEALLITAEIRDEFQDKVQIGVINCLVLG